MTTSIKGAAGVVLVVAGMLMLNVSSPNYAAVLSIATASFGLAAILFELSARSATGKMTFAFRGALVLAIALGAYAGWGVLRSL